MSPESVIRSPRGDVHLGAFTEVLNIPGRYLNDHCLIRPDGVWHLFAIVGSVDDRREVSIAHAVSPDLLRWEVLPDAIQPGAVLLSQPPSGGGHVVFESFKPAWADHGHHEFGARQHPINCDPGRPRAGLIRDVHDRGNDVPGPLREDAVKVVFSVAAP